MLTIHDHLPTRTCAGRTRRDFLRIGSLALGGLTLTDLLAARALAGTGSSGRHKSVVLLFLQGGPTQLETWDPKPDAPAEYRTIVDTIPTAHPGIRFSKFFPKLAAAANDFALFHSFASGNGGHSYEAVTTGGNKTKASMSAAYANLAGGVSPENSLPTNLLLLPEAVQNGLKLKSNFETQALPTLTQTGTLGSQYEAFNPAGGSTLTQNMTLSLPREQFDNRRKLLGSFDSLRHDLDRRGGLANADKFQQQAFDIITRGVTDAFDLSKEDPQTLARYDTSKLFKLEEATKWGDMRRSSNLLGKQLLLARRLCESGAGFVTVSDCGWDMHANGNSPKQMEGLKWLAPQVDHAVAAFLEDVKQRGLSDDILLVVTGEMGRTPKLNKNGGRDHYGNITPLLMAGGGMKMGQVIGKSDTTASKPVSKTYTPADLFSTVMHYLVDVPQLRLRTDLNRDLMAALDRPTIPELM
ncbi:MAG: DUF1501 domain-containing protein [Zavarzinella sp.]